MTMETTTITEYAKIRGVKRDLVDSRYYNGNYGRKAGLKPVKGFEEKGWSRPYEYKVSDLDAMMSNYNDSPVKVKSTKQKAKVVNTAPEVNQTELESAVSALRNSDVDTKSFLYIMEAILEKK